MSEVLRAPVNLNHVQIKTIPLDAAGVVQLLPAPGIGKAYLFIDSLLLLDTSAGAYAAGFGSNWHISYGINGIPASGSTPTQALLEGAQRSWIRLGPARFIDAAPGFEGLLGGSSGLVADIENQALYLSDNQAGAPYSGGNEANTVGGELLYVVTDV